MFARVAPISSYRSTEILDSFLFVVLGAYRQMRQQDQPILSDVNEDNFDGAFAMFKPGMFH